MASDIRKKLLLFDGHADVTFLELNTWMSAMCKLVGGNQLYADKLKEAINVLTMLSKPPNNPESAKVGYQSRLAACHFLKQLTMVSDFHKEVLGEFRKFTHHEGPFRDLLKVNDRVFELTKNKSSERFREHEKLQKEAEKARKYFLTQLKKKDKLHQKLAKTLTWEEIRRDKQFVIFNKKLETAMSRYNTCFRKELEQRRDLAEQTESLRKQFLKDEKAKLDTMFSFISDLMGRIEKLIPRGLVDASDVDFETKVVKTRAMARARWEAYLKEHVFPERKDRNLTITAIQDEDDDDRSSDDEDEDEGEDEDTATVSKGVESLAAPKLNNDESGMNDILEEILASLDDETKLKIQNNDIKDTATGTKVLPPTCSSTTDHKSHGSMESRNSVSVCKRLSSQGCSCKSRKYKPQQTSHDIIINSGSPYSGNGCRQQAAHNRTSLVPRKQLSSDPSTGATKEDLTSGETSASPSARGKSLPRKSLRRHNPDDSKYTSRSKSNNEACLRRHTAADASQGVVYQDPDAKLDINSRPSHEHSHLVEPAREYPAADVDTEEVKRGQSNNDTREQMESQVRASEPSRGYPARAVSPHEVKRRHRTDFVSNSDGANTESQVRISGRNKEPDDNTGVMSKSCRHRKAAKEAKNGPHEIVSFSPNNPSVPNNSSSAALGNKPSNAQVSSSQDVTEEPRSKERKDSRFEEKASVNSKESNYSEVKLPYDDKSHICWRSDIAVYALKDWERKTSNEISIKAGMKLKQTRATDPHGMAYGYTKTKFGLKKYGFYPAFLVGLQPPHEAV